MSTLVIIGAGMMGSAMSVPASDNGHLVRVVGTHLDREIIEHARKTSRHLTMKRELPKSNRYYQLEEMKEALEGADFVICGVSSFGMDWFLEQAVPGIPDRLPVLMVTKGLLDHPDGTLETFPHFLARRSSRPGRFSAVGGPCTSYELADRQHSAVAFCGEDALALRMFRDALRTDYYHISLSSDVTGVETAVAMKNAYALAVSLAIGLHEKEFGEGGALTFTGARRGPELARSLPAEWLVLESDAPDLAPEPYRGQINRPAYLPLIAAHLADLRGWSLAETAAITTGNARRVLGLHPY